MTPERWRRISGLFEEALTLAAGDRAAFLAGLADDERTEVESLLAHASDATTDGPMSAIAGVARGLLTDADASAWLGRRLGPWQLTRVLGVGGMGIVFAAEHHAFAKRAAIKLVRQTLRDPLMLARFRQERQILARLEHPNVARLYDGDAVDGQPYLVMEYVEGEPLLAWCAARRVDLAGRLRLFVAICGAVEHAHRNLVVHRDLKPSNILVGADGQPKLLDFGIAKLIGEDEGEARTATSDRLMTPEYASPEQVRGEPVSTATDVYALGAILSELLTGERAQPVRSMADVVRVICEAPPRRPSAVARAAGQRAQARALAGDLDTIVLQALRKEPGRRYPSVAALGEDVRRHLADLPIAARPDAIGYRWGKFVRRNRLAAALAGLVLVSLVGGLAATLTLARAQAEAAARAERRFAEVRRLANTFLFEFDAEIARVPGTAAARELVTRTAQTYLAGLALEAGDDPVLLAELATAYVKLARIQGRPDAVNLGRTQAALDSYRAAVELWRRLVALDPTARAARRGLCEALTEQKDLHMERREYDVARVVIEEAVAIADGLVSPRGPSDPEAEPAALAADLDAAGDANMAFGTYLRDTEDFAGAVAALTAAEALRRQALALAPTAERARRLGLALERLARVRMMKGELTEGLRVAQQVLDLRAAEVARDPLDAEARRLLLLTHHLLAQLYYEKDGPSLGDLPRSREHAAQMLALAEPLAAADPANMTAVADLVRARMAVAGGLVDAEPGRAAELYAAALAAGERLPDGPEREFVRALVGLYAAVPLRQAGRIDEAAGQLAAGQAAAERLERSVEAHNESLRASLASEAALVAEARGQLEPARALHAEAVREAEASVAATPEELSETVMLGQVLARSIALATREGRDAEACALARRRAAAWQAWQDGQARGEFSTAAATTAATDAAGLCAKAPG